MSNLRLEVEAVHHSLIREALPGTVIITVVRAKNIETHKKKIMLELSNETNREQSQSSLHVKKLEGKIEGRISHTVEWNEKFYYNTLEMVDDNITFTLREQNQRDSYGSEDYLAKVTCQSIGRFTEQELKKGGNCQNRTLQLKNRDNQTAAELQIIVEFIQQQDIIGGVSIPCLSLAPAEGFKPKYNALDLYVPPQILPEGAQVKPENKYNCFNFYDGDKIPGFDQIDIFPAKFKEANPRQKHKVDIFSVWQ